MSDTDSAVLSKPLPKYLVGKGLGKYLVGKGLGQMKLENKNIEGLFIRKKLYYLKNSNNQEIIKSSGIDSNRLNYNLFLNLLNGESIEIERVNFNVGWKDLTLTVVSSTIFIHGIHNVKTIYNTPDVNFKFISKYNPNYYTLIIHPLFPIANNVKRTESENKIKINNHNFVKLSTLEKFIIFIFLFSFFFLFILFLYKIY